MIEVVRREIERAKAGMRTALRAVLKGGVTRTRVQRLNAEALAGEALRDVELMQQFGFTSAPPEGAQLVLIPLGGRTSAAVVVASEHGTYRFKVDAQGEAALYNQWGDVIHLKQDRSIHVVAALKVQIDSPLSSFSGDVDVAGNITSGANITAAGNVADQGGTKTMAGMRAAYNGHNHSDPQGGSVGAPSGSM